jgi:hypothetical protein
VCGRAPAYARRALRLGLSNVSHNLPIAEAGEGTRFDPRPKTYMAVFFRDWSEETGWFVGVSQPRRLTSLGASPFGLPLPKCYFFDFR